MDASAFLEYLLRTPRSDSLQGTIEARDVDVSTPALCDVEVVAGLRRAWRSKLLSQKRAVDALRDYLDLPVTRHSHVPLLFRAFALRENFSAYDAAYVALAEGLGAALLTADSALARAAKAHARIETLPA